MLEIFGGIVILIAVELAIFLAVYIKKMFGKVADTPLFNVPSPDLVAREKIVASKEVEVTKKVKVLASIAEEAMAQVEAEKKIASEVDKPEGAEMDKSAILDSGVEEVKIVKSTKKPKVPKVVEASEKPATVISAALPVVGADGKVELICSKCGDKYRVYPVRAFYTCSNCNTRMDVVGYIPTADKKLPK
jgi:hypothetical protein